VLDDTDKIKYQDPILIKIRRHLRLMAPEHYQPQITQITLDTMMRRYKRIRVIRVICG